MAGIEGWEWVAALRRSPWGYGGVNAAHILGIALLIGSIVNVDLRIVGIWRGDRWREGMAESLPVARAGFALAAVTGAVLFAVGASRYAALTPFLLKMALLVLALLNVAAFHGMLRRTGERTAALRLSAAMSLLLWIGVLASGRAIGFV